MMQVATGVIGVLLGLLSLSTAQVNLRTCGDESSDITCSFFFEKLDDSFRQRDILYTLRKSFFPTGGAPPTLFDIFMTLEVENAPNARCTAKNYTFGKEPVTNPPAMETVCQRYKCGSYNITWQHQWSKTILATFIEQEDLELLQNTNIFAFSAAKFNSFDTSVFSEEDDTLRSNTTNNGSELSQTGRGMVQFVLTIDFLPCRPDDRVLQRAWEDLLIWVSHNTAHFMVNGTQYLNVRTIQCSMIHMCLFLAFGICIVLLKIPRLILLARYREHTMTCQVLTQLFSRAQYVAAAICSELRQPRQRGVHTGGKRIRISRGREPPRRPHGPNHNHHTHPAERGLCPGLHIHAVHVQR